MSAEAHITSHLWRFQDNFVQLIFYILPYVNSGNWTYVVRLGQQILLPAEPSYQPIPYDAFVVISNSFILFFCRLSQFILWNKYLRCRLPDRLVPWQGVNSSESGWEQAERSSAAHTTTPQKEFFLFLIISHNHTIRYHTYPQHW